MLLCAGSNVSYSRVEEGYLKNGSYNRGALISGALITGFGCTVNIVYIDTPGTGQKCRYRRMSIYEKIDICGQ